METKKYRFTKNNFLIDQAPTFVEDTSRDLKEIKKRVRKNVKKMYEQQRKLYAQKRFGILIVLQGMDAAGKDSMIRHVFSGMNPEGFDVFSFKQPTKNELMHDFLWRMNRALPKRGNISIMNRSYYEDVLVQRVHPEIVLQEDIPTIHGLKDVNEAFWFGRYESIRNYEAHLARNGFVILKFFLHESKAEQKKRFLRRLNIPKKNWKFSAADIRERKYWQQYQDIYQVAINSTVTAENPWYVIPADDKWYARLLVSDIMTQEFEKLPLAYPKMPKNQEKDLQAAKNELEKE